MTTMLTIKMTTINRTRYNSECIRSETCLVLCVHVVLRQIRFYLRFAAIVKCTLCDYARERDVYILEPREFVGNRRVFSRLRHDGVSLCCYYANLISVHNLQTSSTFVIVNLPVALIRL